MNGSEESADTEQAFDRVSSWISRHDFHPHADQEVETNLVDGITDITSVTKNIEQRRQRTDGFVVEERTDVVKCTDGGDDDHLVKALTKFSQYSPFEKRRTRTASPTHFSVIVEGEELELPDTKRSDPSVKCIKVQQQFQQHHKVVDHHQHQQQPPPRPSSRHKRHAVDPLTVSRPSQMEKKTRKRRTLEKIGASVIFRNFLNAFLESTLVGAILVVFDVLLNSSPILPEYSYFY